MSSPNVAIVVGEPKLQPSTQTCRVNRESGGSDGVVGRLTGDVIVQTTNPESIVNHHVAKELTSSVVRSNHLITQEEDDEEDDDDKSKARDENNDHAPFSQSQRLDLFGSQGASSLSFYNEADDSQKPFDSQVAVHLLLKEAEHDMSKNRSTHNQSINNNDQPASEPLEPQVDKNGKATHAFHVSDENNGQSASAKPDNVTREGIDASISEEKIQTVVVECKVGKVAVSSDEDVSSLKRIAITQEDTNCIVQEEDDHEETADHPAEHVESQPLFSSQDLLLGSQQEEFVALLTKSEEDGAESPNEVPTAPSAEQCLPQNETTEEDMAAKSSMPPPPRPADLAIAKSTPFQNSCPTPSNDKESELNNLSGEKAMPFSSSENENMALKQENNEKDHQSTDVSSPKNVVTSEDKREASTSISGKSAQTNSSSSGDTDNVKKDKESPTVEFEDTSSRSTDEDVALTEMERSGAMTQVVGSQSLLSQEIAMHYTPSDFAEEDDHPKAEPNDPMTAEKAGNSEEETENKEQTDGPRTPVQSSRIIKEEDQTTPASTARRYGLILPREGDEKDTEIPNEKNEQVQSGEEENSDKLTDCDPSKSSNCIQEEENEVSDERPDHTQENSGFVGGESLSQQLDLRGLSQELTGVSQDTLAWADAQMSSQGGGVVPSVTPVCSASQSQEFCPGGPTITGRVSDISSQSSSCPGPLFFGGGNSSVTKGLECLLQAADQVSAVEVKLPADGKNESSSTPRRNRSATTKRQGETSGGRTRKKAKTENSKAKSGGIKNETKGNSRKKASKATNVKEEFGVNSPSRRTSKRKGVLVDSEIGEGKKKKAKSNTTVTASSSTQKPDNVLAQEAADLAARVIHEEHLGKQLLLSMVMERQPTRTPPETLPSAGHEMPASFVWSHYPPLEKVLRDHMEEYYELSLQKRQSAAQQAFNNDLVDIVRTTARNDWGWTVPSLDDKALRDRIRCYYKTHIQNAKKRLATMLKNPRKVANARHLVHHLQLIKQTLENPKPAPMPRKKSIKKLTNKNTSPSSAADTTTPESKAGLEEEAEDESSPVPNESSAEQGDGDESPVVEATEL